MALLGKLMFARLIENIYLQRSQTKFDPLERGSHKHGQKTPGKIVTSRTLGVPQTTWACLVPSPRREKYSVSECVISNNFPVIAQRIFNHWSASPQI